jgi:hypothetical protein
MSSDSEVLSEGEEEALVLANEGASELSYKYNKVGLEAKLEEIALPASWPWIEVFPISLLTYLFLDAHCDTASQS